MIDNRSRAIKNLRQASHQGNLIPFIGAGVSTAVAGVPSWLELLDCCLEEMRLSSLLEKELEKKINQKKESGDILGAFEICQGALGGSESDRWQAFIVKNFDNIQVDQQDHLIRSIRDLNARIIVTTNYDTIVRDHVFSNSVEVLTWDEYQLLLSRLRVGKAVFHLHGRHEVPDSMILTTSDYSRILNSDDRQKIVTNALFHSGVLLFIGCSIEGVTDRHLGDLLSGFKKLLDVRKPDDIIPHYLLIKGEASAEQVVKLRSFGIEPLSYGNDFSDLPGFLERISHREENFSVRAIRNVTTEFRDADTLSRAIQSIGDFVRDEVYKGHQVRIGFAKKVTCSDNGGVELRNTYIIPKLATHNVFSYPQSLASWALIEGKILSFPADWDKPCDFDRLRHIDKYKYVSSLLGESRSKQDPVMHDFLDSDEIMEKSIAEELTIREIYQHWVGRQPEPHYRHFISVPVPLIERISNRNDWPEYGVFNIDTNEVGFDLLNHRTSLLLNWASDMTSLAFERFNSK